MLTGTRNKFLQDASSCSHHHCVHVLIRGQYVLTLKNMILSHFGQHQCLAGSHVIAAVDPTVQETLEDLGLTPGFDYFWNFDCFD